MVALLARQMIQGKTLQAACEGILLEFSVSSQTGLTKNIEVERPAIFQRGFICNQRYNGAVDDWLMLV